MSAGKIILGGIVAMLAGIPGIALAQAVTIAGCPQPGVEASCLVIRDAAGTLYDISAATPPPDRQKGEVSLTGTPSSKITFCMQGSILDKIEWHYTGRPCAAPKPD